MNYPDVPRGMRITDQPIHENIGNPWTAEKEQQLVQLRAQGFTWMEIAAEMGKGKTTVREKYLRMQNGLCRISKE